MIRIFLTDAFFEGKPNRTLVKLDFELNVHGKHPLFALFVILRYRLEPSCLTLLQRKVGFVGERKIQTRVECLAIGFRQAPKVGGRI